MSDRQPDEETKLEIWVRSEFGDKRKLELWGTSETASRVDVTGLRVGTHSCNIEDLNRYVAVQAFCRGNIVTDDIPGGSRWTAFVSVPVMLSDAPWYGPPVGVANLMSTSNLAQSVLVQLDLTDAADRLIRVGRLLLDPASECWVSQRGAWPAWPARPAAAFLRG